MKNKLITISIIVGCIVGLIYISFPSSSWSGATNKEVSFTIKDNSTDKPVDGALVLFLRDSDKRNLEHLNEIQRKQTIDSYIADMYGAGITNENGFTKFKKMFSSGGSGGFLGMKGRLRFEGEISVIKEGFDKLSILAQNITGEKRHSLDHDNFNFTLYIDPIER
tara:strand:+ start:456 stop:950 length:495 start_codon:yes stop_codon:yes gene_type:complete